MAKNYGIPDSVLFAWSKHATKVSEETCAAFDAAMFLDAGTAWSAWQSYCADRAEEEAKERRRSAIHSLGAAAFHLELGGELLSLAERAQNLGVSLLIVFDEEEGRHIVRVRENPASWSKSGTADKKRGGRTAPNVENAKYLHNGEPFNGSLKAHILATYPESNAAKRIREYANKKKSGLSAWVACQGDKDIAHHYTRR